MNITLIAAAALAFLVCLTGSLTGGGREAWDLASCWTIGLPAIYLAVGVLGYLSTERVWKLALWAGFGQLAALIVTGSGGLSRLPLGVVLLGVLNLPAIVAAMAGGRCAESFP